MKTRFPVLFGIFFFVMGVAYVVKAPLTIDWIAIFLFLIAFVPWIGNIIEEVDWKNGVFRPRRHGEAASDAPAMTVAIPPAPEGAKAPASKPEWKQFPVGGKKVLATLWRYQTRAFGADLLDRHWTFLVLPQASDYPEFFEGVVSTAASGLVALNRKNSQIMLTEHGFRFCRENRTEVESFPALFGNWG